MEIAADLQTLGRKMGDLFNNQCPRINSFSISYPLDFAFPQYLIWTLAIPVSLGVIFLVYRRGGVIIPTRFWGGGKKRGFPLP